MYHVLSSHRDGCKIAKSIQIGISDGSVHTTFKTVFHKRKLLLRDEQMNGR